MSRGGIPVLDARTRPCKVEKIGKYRFRIILTQGLNRQIQPYVRVLWLSCEETGAGEGYEH